MKFKQLAKSLDNCRDSAELNDLVCSNMGMILAALLTSGQLANEPNPEDDDE